MTTSTDPHLWFDASVRSAVGPRDRNEDAAVAAATCFVIADGVGGGPAGDVAAQTACVAVEQALRRDHRSPAGALHDAFGAAGVALALHAAEQPADSGLATTLTAATLVGRTRSGEVRVLLAWVGDSPAWHFQRASGTLARVAGDLPSDDGILGSWLSDTDGNVPLLASVDLGPHDWIIAASDGLDVLGTLDLAEAMARHGSGATPARVANDLLARARQAGLCDNTTVIAARARRGAGAMSPTAAAWRSNRPGRSGGA